MRDPGARSVRCRCLHAVARILHQRGWLMRTVVVLLLVLAASCLIPPPLEVEGSDGGSNHPPKILLDFLRPPPGDLTVDQTAPGKKKASEPFTIVVNDPDPQVVYMNAFLDGIKDGYVKPFKTSQAPPQEGNRSFSFYIDGLCDELVNYLPGRYDLEFYFSDSGFPTEGDQHEPLPGGQMRSILWRLQCVLPAGGP